MCVRVCKYDWVHVVCASVYREYTWVCLCLYVLCVQEIVSVCHCVCMQHTYTYVHSTPMHATRVCVHTHAHTHTHTHTRVWICVRARLCVACTRAGPAVAVRALDGRPPHIQLQLADLLVQSVQLGFQADGLAS